MVKLVNVLMVMTASIFMMVCGQTRSVIFIESKKFNFFMTKGKVVKDMKMDYILTHNMNSCKCKSACIAVDCAAWSITEMDNGTVICRLDKEGPYYDPPKNDNDHDSTYFYRQDKIPGTYFSLGDGLLYVEFTERMSHNNAVIRCNGLPGHRLIIIKTLNQWNALRSYATYDNYYAMNMQKKIENGIYEIILGDGTNLKDTEISEARKYNSAGMDEEVYVYLHYYLHDSPQTIDNRVIICQANPFGVEW